MIGSYSLARLHRDLHDLQNRKHPMTSTQISGFGVSVPEKEDPLISTLGLKFEAFSDEDRLAWARQVIERNVR